MSTAHLARLREVADLPTAPFVEDHVVTYIRAFAAEWEQLSLQADPFGNLLIEYVPGAAGKKAKARAGTKAGKGAKAGVVGRPILFAAHMDHPGFIAGKPVGSNRLRAEWVGGVQVRYFQNQGVKFWADGRWVHGRIEEVVPAKTPASRKKGGIRLKSARDLPPASVVIWINNLVPPGSPGMWDLPDGRIIGPLFHARATDDLSGLAAVLCTLEAICRKRGPTPCYALFTRAEEAGFAGALAALDGRTIPREVMIVAVENSKAIPGVTLGAGPVLRVGDRMTVFTPALTDYCHSVAEQLAKKDDTFSYQRKFMDGGACEATAYCHYGYAANCICLPLLNYHNMDTVNVRIAPEAIDTRDYLNMVKLFIALAESPARMKLGDGDKVVAKRLDGLLKKHRERLRKTTK